MTENKAEVLKCLRCNKKRLNIVNTYSTKSDISYNNRMIVCKDCVIDIYDIYHAIVHDERSATFKTCRRLDIPYYNTLFDMVMKMHNEKGSHVFQMYVAKLNSIGFKQGYRGILFEDGEKSLPTDSNMTDEEESEYFQSSVKKWGRAYKSIDDFQFLDDRYEKYAGQRDQDEITFSDVVTMENICKQDLLLEQRRTQNLDIKNEMKTWDDLMKAANLRPADIKLADANSNKEIMGRIIADIEKNEPADYFKDKKLYHDADGLEDMWNKYIKRPIKNILANLKDFDVS